jgi:hypothetical protein
MSGNQSAISRLSERRRASSTSVSARGKESLSGERPSAAAAVTFRGPSMPRPSRLAFAGYRHHTLQRETIRQAILLEDAGGGFFLIGVRRGARGAPVGQETCGQVSYPKTDCCPAGIARRASNGSMVLLSPKSHGGFAPKDFAPCDLRTA